MERCIEETEKSSLMNTYLPMTAQKTFTGSTLKRTKFFFGYRYMWTKTQLQEPLSNVAAGVRCDVSQPPVWMKTVLEQPLVKAGIIEKDFINSIALNVYHDGSEGLAQHFDDATRFKQPIFTVRLFSDSRLSFGSQYYGFCNGAFTIPLPRGCICVMEEGSYSANGVKHCIRPCDMTGKSSAVILRQMHPSVVQEATKYDRYVDLPMWMSSLSLEDNSTPYYQQKEYECSAIEKALSHGSAQVQTAEKQKHVGLQQKNQE